MKVVKFEDFMKLANFFYTSIGVRPYDKPGYTRTRRIIFNMILCFGLINTNVQLLGEIVFVLLALKNGNNFVAATMTLSYIGFVTVGEFKMVSVWRKRNALTNFMQELNDIFPRSPEEQEQYQLRRYLRQSTWITNAFALLYMVLIWTYNLFILGQYFIYDHLLHLREIELTLPYFVSMPWNWRGNWSYYLLYAAQNLAGYTTAAGQISCDLLLCAVATQVIMHYDHLARSITLYKTNSSEGETQKKDMEFLASMIAYHNKVLSLSEQMNDVFGVPLLFNFMTSSCVICFVGFQMTIGISADYMFKLVLFLVCSIAQVYLICHHGQMLIDASLSISQAVYNQNWPDAHVHYQKMLVLINARAQKPAILKATMFLKISRNTMTDIMQLSYKFFALLRTMYSN